MAAVQICEAPLGGADRLSTEDETVWSPAKLSRQFEDAPGTAKATWVHSFAFRTTFRETLSLPGPRPAGIHVRGPTRATGPPVATPFSHAPCACWDSPRRNLKQEG